MALAAKSTVTIALCEQSADGSVSNTLMRAAQTNSLVPAATVLGATMETFCVAPAAIETMPVAGFVTLAPGTEPTTPEVSERTPNQVRSSTVPVFFTAALTVMTFVIGSLAMLGVVNQLSLL